nr:hypothetical protein [Tanacetum cinerariifolium]
SSGLRRFFRYAMFIYSFYLCYVLSLYSFTERYAQPYFFHVLYDRGALQMLFTINPHPTVKANINVESLPSLSIPVQDGDSQREEIDIVTNTDDVLPLGVENDDSDEEVDAVDDLRVDNSISNSKHEFSESDDSDFDNPSVP